MNKYELAVTVAVFAALAAAVPMGLKYSQAAILFDLIAALSAPVVIHKIPSVRNAVGMLFGLSYFASFPTRKLFQIEGFIHGLSITLAYYALLWAIGFGWKRSWH